MKRIVWICGAFLVIFLIIGISINTLNNIDRVNNRNREEQEAKDIAASIAAATENETSIWEYIRENEETTPLATTDPSEAIPASGDPAAPTDAAPTEEATNGFHILN